jgi:hypothetical protein
MSANDLAYLMQQVEDEEQSRAGEQAEAAANDNAPPPPPSIGEPITKRWDRLVCAPVSMMFEATGLPGLADEERESLSYALADVARFYLNEADSPAWAWVGLGVTSLSVFGSRYAMWQHMRRASAETETTDPKAKQAGAGDPDIAAPLDRAQSPKEVNRGPTGTKKAA